MKIDRKVMSSIRFKDIEKGDVFIDDDGDVCMKTECLFVDSVRQNVNAVTLNFGDLFFIEDDNFVWLPKFTKLTVED